MSKHTNEPALSATEYAIRTGLWLNYVYVKLRTGRIPGAQRVNGQWQIPASALKEAKRESA